MTDHDHAHALIVRELFDELLIPMGFRRKKMMWQKRTDETTFIVDVQKSQYGPQYYVNVSVWLLVVEDRSWPAENKAHIRTRLDELLEGSLQQSMKEWLDFESGQSIEERRAGLPAIVQALSPFIDAAGSIETLGRSASGKELLSKSLVKREAMAVLR